MTTTFTRDANDRLTTIESRTSGGTLLAQYAYTLDVVGNRTGVVEQPAGRRVTWQYDTLYRLLSEAIEVPGQPAETEVFSYDPVGNRVLRTTSEGVEVSAYDDNDRLLSDGTATYSWDENGNLISRTDPSGTTLYRWDARDRLEDVETAGSTLISYRYDHAGDRIARRVDDVATQFLIDANRGLSQVWEERDSQGYSLARYLHDDAGNPLVRIDLSGFDPARFALLHDAQGSVRQLVGESGAATDRYDYSAFGETLIATGSAPNPYRFGGQREEREVGLYHLRARWMDPGAGRFVSRDKFGGFAHKPVTTNEYIYAASNPIRFADANGNFATLVEASVSIGIANGLSGAALPWRVARVPILMTFHARYWDTRVPGIGTVRFTQLDEPEAQKWTSWERAMVARALIILVQRGAVQDLPHYIPEITVEYDKHPNLVEWGHTLPRPESPQRIVLASDLFATSFPGLLRITLGHELGHAYGNLAGAISKCDHKLLYAWELKWGWRLGLPADQQARSLHYWKEEKGKCPRRSS